MAVVPGGWRCNPDWPNGCVLVETLPGAPGPYRILHTCLAQSDWSDQMANGPASSHLPLA